MYLNRTLCDVLHEMRDCAKTGNYSYLPGLIEEAQSMANRMESKLCQIKDIDKVEQRWHDLKGKEKELRERERAVDPDPDKDQRISVPFSLHEDLDL